MALAARRLRDLRHRTKEPGREVVRVEGIGAPSSSSAGFRRKATGFGSADAPVSIQVFADMQCGSCREDFLTTIPGLAEKYARPGDAKLLLRHYSVARNPLELGFFGAEAAAEQNYGWQYTYLFFVNQDEAERFGVGEELMDSLAGAIGDLDVPEWKEYLESNGGTGGAIAERLEAYAELGDRARHPHPAGDDRQRPRGHPDAAGRPLAGPGRTRDRGSRRRGLTRPGRRPHLKSLDRVS